MTEAQVEVEAPKVDLPVPAVEVPGPIVEVAVPPVEVAVPKVEAVAAEAGGDADKTTQLPSLAPLAPDPAPASDNLETYKMQPIRAPDPLPRFEDSVTIHRSEPPPAAAPRPSWIKSLLVTSFPPPGVAPSPDQVRLTRRAAGAVLAILGLAAAVVALVTGLRGIPDDPQTPETVVVAVLLARALIAVGAGTFSFAMFRMTEKLVTDPR
jgi:hypothetical protein